jgi:hypothetical protein
LAFADDIDMIGRTQKAMKEAFINLERAAKKMHLEKYQDKTKYMEVTKNEVVYSFTYLGSEVNCKNDQ